MKLIVNSHYLQEQQRNQAHILYMSNGLDNKNILHFDLILVSLSSTIEWRYRYLNVTRSCEEGIVCS